MTSKLYLMQPDPIFPVGFQPNLQIHYATLRQWLNNFMMLYHEKQAKTAGALNKWSLSNSHNDCFTLKRGEKQLTRLLLCNKIVPVFLMTTLQTQRKTTEALT